MSDYYQSGDIVEKDAALAYGWALISARSVEGRPFAPMYAVKVNWLIPKLSPKDLAKGQAFADAFHVISDPGFTDFELSLDVAQLKVTAIVERSGVTRILINEVAFAVGEAKPVPIDGTPVVLRCMNIGPTSGEFDLSGRHVTLGRSRSAQELK